MAEEFTLPLALFSDKETLTVVRCEHGPQIDITVLLKKYGKTRVVFCGRSYLLRLTAKGGVQLCAEE